MSDQGQSNQTMTIGFRSKSGPEWERETAPTLLATCYKDGGGHIFSFNFELYDPGQRECMGCIAARRAHDWLVYNR